MNPKMVAITGHTSGLGLELANRLRQLSWRIQGYSRQNGYDLGSAETIQKIAGDSAACGLFINNAFAEWAQIDLLYEIFDKWKYQDKCIINISSTSSDGIKNYVHKYAVQKAALDKACEQLAQVEGSRCSIINIRPGWMDTPRVLHVTGVEKISPGTVADSIIWLLNLPPGVRPATLSIHPTPARFDGASDVSVQPC